MKKNNFLLLILYLFAFFTCHSESLFKEIHHLNNYEVSLINDDFSNLDIKTLILYFLTVSDETDSIASFLPFFLQKTNIIQSELFKIYGTSNFQSVDNAISLKVAEDILLLMHKHFLSEYDLNSFTASPLHKFGLYNCVSSSIVYSILLVHFGFTVEAVETKDHVFITITLANKTIDVETTNKYGFDPGTRKEFHDNFGKITGFSYVSPKNYRERNIISIKKLFLLVSHNLASYYTRQKEFIKAAHSGFIIKEGRDDKKGDNEYIVYFSNLVKYLASDNQLEIAFSLTKSLINKIQDPQIYGLQFEILADMAKKTESIDQFQIIISTLDFINNESKNILKTKYNQVKQYCIYKITQLYIHEKLYDDAYLFIFQNKEEPYMTDLLNNVYYSLNAHLTQGTISFIDVLDILNRSKNFDFDKTKIFQQYLTIILNNKIVILSKNNEFDEAIELLEKFNNINDETLNLVKKNVYINYGYFLFTQSNFKEAIAITAKGISLFKNDTSLLNNLKFFFHKAIANETNIEYKKELLLEARHYFPTEKGFLQYE